MNFNKLGLSVLFAMIFTIFPSFTVHAERQIVNYGDPKISSGLNNLQSIEGTITTFTTTAPLQHSKVAPGASSGSYFGDSHWNVAFMAVYGDGSSTAYMLPSSGSNTLYRYSIDSTGVYDGGSIQVSGLCDACLTAKAEYDATLKAKQDAGVYTKNTDKLFIKKGTTNIVEPAFFVRWSNDFSNEYNPDSYTSRDNYGTDSSPYDIPVFTDTSQDQITGPLWASSVPADSNYYNQDNLVTKDTLTKFLGYNYDYLVSKNPTFFARTAAWQKWASVDFTVQIKKPAQDPQSGSSTPFSFTINELQAVVANRALLFHKAPTISEKITPEHITTKVEGGKANISVSITGPSKGSPLTIGNVYQESHSADEDCDWDWGNMRPKKVDYYYSSINSKLEVKDIRDRLAKSSDIQSSDSSKLSYQLNDIEFNKDAIGYARAETYYTYKENMDWVSSVVAIGHWESDDKGHSWWVFDYWEPHYAHLDIQYPNSGNSLPILSSKSSNITLIGNNGVSYTIDELNDIVKKYDDMNASSTKTDIDGVTTKKSTTVDTTAFKNQLEQLTKLQSNSSSSIYLPEYGEAAIDGKNYLNYEKKFFVQGLTQNTDGTNNTDANTSKAKDESKGNRDTPSETGK